ncbi:MAG: hypothetical protein ACKV22_35000 [Bryobacteraceae bacterium]
MNDWPQNYFNYFTEIEEHFQKARGTGLFLLSPIDWALIESWKNEGVPLEAVLIGIDISFEKWRKRKSRTQNVNSLAFCSQAVLAEAERMANAGTDQPKAEPAPAPFSAGELRAYLESNASQVSEGGLPEIAEALRRLAVDAETYERNLEELEQRLSALEGKLIAALTSRQSEEQLFSIRRDLDGQLRPYRSKMSSPQLAMLEKQYFERRLLESAGLPRLSLFYMR